MRPQKTRKKRPPKRPLPPWIPVAVVGTIAVIAVVLVIVVSNATSSGNSNTPAKTTPGPTASAPQQGASFGRPDAPVTMVEYYSFQCSYCADFAASTEPQIEKDYVDTGKLRIEFHALGAGDVLLASEAVACAGDQGHYVEYYKYLFANRLRGFSEGTLKEYARDLGLDTAAFGQCLDSHKHRQTIVDDTSAASLQKLGTPAFYLGKTSAMENQSLPYANATNIPGAQPYQVFKSAIEQLLGSAQ